jgi:hypothetical protein
MEDTDRLSSWRRGQLALQRSMDGYKPLGRRSRQPARDFEGRIRSLGVGRWQAEEEKLHQLLFEPDMSGVRPALRRRASDLAGWPEVNRIVHWVEFDCEAHRLHKLAWKEFKKALEGIGTLSKQRAARVKSEAVIRLRQKSSLLKVEDSIELCLELLDNGRQVAISCEFLDDDGCHGRGVAKEENQLCPRRRTLYQ